MMPSSGSLSTGLGSRLLLILDSGKRARKKYATNINGKFFFAVVVVFFSVVSPCFAYKILKVQGLAYLTEITLKVKHT